ncbi:hypothetical protein [Rhabdaerophilum sp.]|uniref:hypothetical protein n=1 Tax=Rhabdaerophilum sp. TaxID=2717341 RepID=UPI0038D447ED
MTETHITPAHREAFNAPSSGDFSNFALFSCFVDGRPSAAIVAAEQTGAEYVMSPLFVAVTPDMVLTDHDGRRA